MYATREKTLALRVGCEFDYLPAQAAAGVFVVRPDSSQEVRFLSERWETTPSVAWHDYRDVYGNSCRRLDLPAEPFKLVYDAVVERDDELDPVVPDAARVNAADLPDEALVYTLPSRFCLSDVLAPRALELFGKYAGGWECVQAICDWVHAHITFGYGSSTATTSSLDVYESGRGVCRDFAHLAITFCRAMNVPARYAFGYLPDIDVEAPPFPMDFCAWFEAFLGDRWYVFDPRNNERRRGRVPIARGRDALDVAMVTTYGPVEFKNMKVWADPVSDARALV